MNRLPLFFLIAFLSCRNNQISSQVSNPPGYYLEKPVIINLPLELDEISGLSYYAKDKSIFAISDEKGVLFKITPYPELKIKTWEFSKKADFEDLVLLDSTFYILQSNGDMHVVRFKGDTVLTDERRSPVAEGMESETLFYDPLTKNIELICKNCEDEKKKSLNEYSFIPGKNLYSDSVSHIDVSALFQKENVKPFHLKPSGAAVSPITGDIFILSSVNRLLLVFDKNKILKSYHPLNPALFKQPEGITFSDNGTLIISNESAKSGTANLLLFNYTK